jgi:hypothetical protein
VAFTRPSAWSVSDSVVHTSGACHCTKGARRTRRGAGIPVRPPAVWVKRTQLSPLSGVPAMSGSAIASNVRATGPSLTVVLPISPPPPRPKSVMRPSSSTSTQPLSTLAKRKRSATRSSSRSSIASGGGSS